MKLEIQQGTTSKRVVIFVQNSSVSTGAGLTGLTSSSSGLAWSYWRTDTGNNPGVSVTLQSATPGSFTSGGFVEIDSTNLPGFYEIGIPNAVLANGATWAVMMLQGATNMAPLPVEFELVGWNPYATIASQFNLKKNTAFSNFQFPMFNTSGAGLTGLTVAGQRSIDGGAFGSCTNAVTENGLGFYLINLSAGDLNGNCVVFRFSAVGALDTDVVIVTQS